MSGRKRILFVDDEPSIRLTLPPVLEENGFEVTTAATVADALVEINSSRFDVLLSDLNIGENGDGFLVVSAMRHIQPRCVNVVLTGFPAFETALQAIRHQVDDYLVKPADLDALIDGLRAKVSNGNGKAVAGKRLAALLRQHSATLVQQVLESLKRDPELSHARLTDQARLGQLPAILLSITTLLEAGGVEPASEDLRLAGEHGLVRLAQGYRAAGIIADFELLQARVYDLIQSHLMTLDFTGLLQELKHLQRMLTLLMKQAVTVYDDGSYQRASA